MRSTHSVADLDIVIEPASHQSAARTLQRRRQELVRECHFRARPRYAGDETERHTRAVLFKLRDPMKTFNWSFRCEPRYDIPPEIARISTILLHDWYIQRLENCGYGRVYALVRTRNPQPHALAASLQAKPSPCHKFQSNDNASLRRISYCAIIR